MSEVNGPKISVSNMSFNGVQKQNTTPETTESMPQLKDFSDSKAEA